MQLTYLKLGDYKNLNGLVIDFKDNENASVIIGNNGSGKSNIIEAISGIFAGLYLHDPKKVFKKANKSSYAKTPFNYTLHYTVKNNTVKIDYDIVKGWKFLVKQEGVAEKEFSKSDFFKRESDLLPSQVIANYSGEENRLFELFYKAFYDSFKKRFIQTGEFSSITQKLHFVNKYFWQLALLSLIYKEKEGNTDITNFFEKTLGIQEINDITFTFNTAKYKRYPDTDTIKFVKAINPTDKKEITLSFDELMKKWKWATDKYFFNLLSTAYLPAEYKIITDIKIDYNKTLDSTCFSEGEKKLILLQFILEVLADEETLILLDEPDSHIHISRKEIIKTLLNKYSSRDSVLTTHSPTLMQSFGMKHLLTLSKDDANIVKLDGSFKEVKDVMEKITDGLWTFEDQNILQYSNKDILLVEGKSDETFIAEALLRLKKTKEKFKDLEFEYLPCGGADGVKLIMKKFKPKKGQTIIAFFDSDGEGWKKINAVFGETSKYNSGNFSKKIKDKICVAAYPKVVAGGNDTFMIEDYFPITKIKGFILDGFTSINTMNKSEAIKRRLERECPTFDDNDFDNFEKLFDLIIDIKTPKPVKVKK